MINYLEGTLNLPVNREKSEVAKFKRRVKSLTHINNPLSMYQITKELKPYLRGWIG